jgi:hypothetical protein
VCDERIEHTGIGRNVRPFTSRPQFTVEFTSRPQFTVEFTFAMPSG